MIGKLKALFMGISISILIGSMIPDALFASEAEETYFGTWSETAYFYKGALDLEEDYHPGSVPSNANQALTNRQLSKNNRLNPSSSSRHGLPFIRGKEHKDYYSLIYTESTRRSSSGLNEARLQLISFGRLII